MEIDIYTKAEIAEIFKVSERTVQSWVKKGLPHFREGRVLRFQLETVVGWVSRNQKKGAV